MRTLYFNPDGSVAKDYKRNTGFDEDTEWLQAKEGNRVIFFEDSTLNSTNDRIFGESFLVDGPYEEDRIHTDQVKHEDLPKNFLMKMLIGAL